MVRAKCICAPPLRTDPLDGAGIWEGLANGTFTTWSSDHAPYNYDDPQGKQVGQLDWSGYEYLAGHVAE